ncbi:uncharacterized protein LOC120218957 [Hibiscus syriacus]|uniref:uncharacterized protein LOC120218957 n=1 Tax=Hibiscus syriacus TaxID=106335 RepID=UPI0019229C15|nr:uncharacterized protein LOC120218957 [Hibiscus syriacus]
MEVVSQEQVRVFKLDATLPSWHHIPPGQFMFLIKNRHSRDPHSFMFEFDPQRLSSADDIRELAFEAILSTTQIVERSNVRSLANNISKHLVDNYRFGLETISDDPDSPKVLIVVDVNQTWVSVNSLYCGMERINNDEAIDDEDVLVALTNSLDWTDFVLQSGRVWGLDSFEVCDHIDIASDEPSMCAICLEDLSGGTCMKLPCSHVFHKGCIVQWIWEQTCPICRSSFGMKWYVLSSF